MARGLSRLGTLRGGGGMIGIRLHDVGGKDSRVCL